MIQKMYPHYYILKILRKISVETGALSVAVLVLILMAGCGGQGENVEEYLLKTGRQIVTRDDFEEALEVAKTAYPYEVLQDQQALRALRSRLFKQLTEEIIIARQADELGLTVSTTELDSAVAVIKKDYPPGVFEETLFENAISLSVWKKRLKMRLIMEKVIRKELTEKMTVTPAEVRAYRAEHSSGERVQKETDVQYNLNIVKQLRREKARQQYPDWIKEIQNNCQVEVNQAMWEEISKK